MSHLIIDAPRRRSGLVRWRDRGLTLLLWAAWSRPVDALTRLAAGSAGPDGGPLWDAFVRDLVGASGTAGVLIALLYARGGYERLRCGSGAPAGPRAVERLRRLWLHSRGPTRVAVTPHPREDQA